MLEHLSKATFPKVDFLNKRLNDSRIPKLGKDSDIVDLRFRYPMNNMLKVLLQSIRKDYISIIAKRVKSDRCGFKSRILSVPTLLGIVLGLLLLERNSFSTLLGAEFRIATFDQSTNFGWNNVFTNAISTIEGAITPLGPWTPLKSYYDKGSVDSGSILTASENHFFRLLQVDVSGTAAGYANLLRSYSFLLTIAGNGRGGIDGVNYWDPSFEGGYARNAALSRPHIAMADHSENIFIADKNSHSILKITPDGRIHTVAGTHGGGFNGEGPAPATSLQLFNPNGLFVHGNGSFLILDTDNGRVRSVETNGIMTTLFKVPGGLTTGRGLWTKKDHSVVYFCSGTSVKKWTPTDGVTVLNSNFNDLGNLDVDSTGHVFVTDRGDNRVYRLSSSGNRTVVAGNGQKTGGGDGFPALDTGLWGVRGICFLNNDGYFLATHEGSQVWYVDPAGIIHLFLDGATDAHSGDRQYFHSPGFKISQPRQITITDAGDLLVTESDFGYVRKITFGRMDP